HLDSRVRWIGSATRDADSLYALRSAACSGVQVRPKFMPGGTTRTLIFEEPDTAVKGHHSIAVFEGAFSDGVLQLGDLTTASRVIIALDMLTRNGIPLAEKVIAACPNIDLLLNNLLVLGPTLHPLYNAIYSFQVRNIFGRRDEMAVLAASLGASLD